jgi:hypothetical protein
VIVFAQGDYGIFHLAEYSLLILLEAPSSAYRGGMLALGKLTNEEEPS